jgi:medium-chain acyl-[acyl-carrier-protein] hydrolase
MFNMWQRLLPGFVDICPVLLPGREARLAETAHTDSVALIEQIATAVAEHLDLPYAIFGHSMGAWLASELAQSLVANGLRPPGHLFVSGRNAAHLPPSVSDLHRLPDDEFLAALGRRYNAMPKEILETPELLELYLPILRADMTLIERHDYRMHQRLACPISVLAGKDDGNVSNEKLMAWQEHTTGTFELKMFDGDHFYLTGASRPLLLELLSERLGVMAATEAAR